MQKTTIYFNRNLYHLEIFGDFYWHISGESIPTDTFLITDFTSLWIKQGSAPLCSSCFVSRTAPLVLQKQPAFSKETVSAILPSILTCLAQGKETIGWQRWDLASETLTHSFDDLSYESCYTCHPPEVNSEGNGDNSYRDTVVEKVLGKASSYDIDALKQYLFSEAIGLVSHHATHAGGELGDLLDGSYLSTIVTSAPRYTQEGVKSVLCSGASPSKELSQLKAIMECIERYAFLHEVTTSPLIWRESAPSAKLDGMLPLLNIDTAQKMAACLAPTFFATGVDVLSKKPALLPLSAFYSIDRLCAKRGQTSTSRPLRVTSNGSAAHFDGSKAVEHSVLELIERDAFFRFWLRPETGIVVKPPEDIEQSFKRLCSALGTRLNNPSLEGRFVLLSSPLSVPVVLAFITSGDVSKPPGFLIGTGASYNCDNAMRHALEELRGHTLNIVARGFHDAGWFAKAPSPLGTGASPKDHSYFYHHPPVQIPMPFISHLLSQELSIIPGHENILHFGQLLTKIQATGMHCYSLDVTPPRFAQFGVRVVRTLIPELYQLYWEHPSPLNLSYCSDLSVADILAHCLS